MIVTTYTHYQQHNTSIKLIAGRQTDRQTDIGTYRAAITAKNDVLQNQIFGYNPNVYL